MTAYVRLSGRLNILAGLLMLTYWYSYVLFMPYEELSTTLSILALHPSWTWINVTGVAGAVCGLLALGGMYAVQADRIGRAGLASFMATLTGAALLLGPMLWDTVIWLPLARHDPAILNFDGPLYSSSAFIPFFVAAGLLWGFGFAAFGGLTARARALPRRAALLVAVGAPLFGLGSLFGPLQAVPRTIGITAFSVGLMWLGSAMTRVIRLP